MRIFLHLGESLSPLQRPLCVVGKLGRWKNESARRTMGRGKREERLPPFPSSHRPPRAFYFLITVFIRFTAQLNFHHFQQEQFVYFATKRKHVIEKVSSSNYSIFVEMVVGRGEGVGMGAYSRRVQIRGWALIRINTVLPFYQDTQREPVRRRMRI